MALNERDAKLLLAAYDIPTPAGTVVHSAQDAARPCRPWAVRPCSKAWGRTSSTRATSASSSSACATRLQRAPPTIASSIEAPDG